MTHRKGLPPYDPIGTCVKCGEHGQHGTDYRGIATMGREVEDEYLKRTCRRCGHSWAEACVDAPGDATQ